MIAIARIDLSIVVPAHNEAERLPTLLAALAARVDLAHTEVIVVDDGSTDDTATAAERGLAGGDLRGSVARVRPNKGKGAAVRAGMALTRGRTIVMMDADLATDLEGLDPLVAALDTHDIAIGSRVVSGAQVVDDAPLRRLAGLALRGVRRMLTPLEVRDTQCGFKAFRGPVGRLLYALSEQDGYGNDIEVLLIAHRLGFTMVESPVVWTAVDGSNVRLVPDAVRTVREILAARRRDLDGVEIPAVRVDLHAEQLRAHVRAVDLVVADGDQGLVVVPGGPPAALEGLAARLRRDLTDTAVEVTGVTVADVARLLRH